LHSLAHPCRTLPASQRGRRGVGPRASRICPCHGACPAGAHSRSYRGATGVAAGAFRYLGTEECEALRASHYWVGSRRSAIVEARVRPLCHPALHSPSVIPHERSECWDLLALRRSRPLLSESRSQHSLRSCGMTVTVHPSLHPRPSAERRA